MSYHDEIERKRAPHESRAIDLIESAIRRQVRGAAASVQMGLGLTVPTQPMERVAKDVYRSAYMDFAVYSYNKTLPAKAEIDEETKRRWQLILIQFFFSNLQVLVSLMNRTIRRDLLLIVQDGVASGLTNEQIAERIRSRQDAIARRRSGARASGLVVPASGHGVVVGGESAGGAQKTWITTLDERTRRGERGFNHAEAHMQTVPLSQPFVVSGEFLRFPGDISLGASAGNVANCRCIPLIQI